MDAPAAPRPPPRLSSQTWTLLVVYILSTLIYVIIAASTEPRALLWLLVSLPFSALVLYDTECLVRGNCDVWSWVRTTLYALAPIIWIILVVFWLMQSRRDTDRDRRPRDRHHHYKH